MYLIIHNIIPDGLTYYLIPSNEIAVIQKDLERLSGVMINADGTEQDEMLYEGIMANIAHWDKYKVSISSICNTKIDGVFTLQIIV